MPLQNMSLPNLLKIFWWMDSKASHLSTLFSPDHGQADWPLIDFKLCAISGFVLYDAIYSALFWLIYTALFWILVVITLAFLSNCLHLTPDPRLSDHSTHSTPIYFAAGSWGSVWLAKATTPQTGILDHHRSIVQSVKSTSRLPSATDCTSSSSWLKSFSISCESGKKESATVPIRTWTDLQLTLHLI